MVSFHRNPCIVWNRHRHKNWQSFWLVILQAKHFIYKCKLDKCSLSLSCFLQQLTVRHKTEDYKSKMSSDNCPPLTWNGFDISLFSQNKTDNFIVCIYVRFRMVTHVTHTESVTQCTWYEGNVCLSVLVRLLVCIYMYVCLCVCMHIFLYIIILCVHRLYMYICICPLSSVRMMRTDLCSVTVLYLLKWILILYKIMSFLCVFLKIPFQLGSRFIYIYIYIYIYSYDAFCTMAICFTHARQKYKLGNNFENETRGRKTPIFIYIYILFFFFSRCAL